MACLLCMCMCVCVCVVGLAVCYRWLIPGESQNTVSCFLFFSGGEVRILLIDSSFSDASANNQKMDSSDAPAKGIMDSALEKCAHLHESNTSIFVRRFQPISSSYGCMAKMPKLPS